MDTKRLEKFCPWARQKLKEGVHLRCLAYGLDDAGRAAAGPEADVVAGRVLTAAEKAQRAGLIRQIGALAEEQAGTSEKNVPSAYERFVAEQAYSWFNRLAAIRYMETKGYLPGGMRLLSAQDGSFDPECLRRAGDLELEGLDQAEAIDLALAGNDEELFRRVIVAQCNELARALPTVFGRVSGSEALTLPDGLLAANENNVVYHLVADLPEYDEDGQPTGQWDDVEVLGWMYQFYNAELKADFFNSKRKAAAADIAPATQLFTPEWIVRYMVENSLGRLWMLNHPQSALRERMAYYIEPDAEHEDYLCIGSPEDITFCDPACGSGHILSYAFELLFAMYEESGYREREIPELILTKNLAGMEIDERAAQIASLVLALRAREHDRRFFKRDVHANVCVLESVPFEEGELVYASKALTEALTHLGEVGSLLAPGEKDLADLRADLAACAGDLFANAKAERLKLAIEKCEALSRRFDVVVANPPYMGSAKFNPFMSGWVKKHYPDVKSDLFSAFIVRIMGFAKDHGECGVMCPFVWMFIGSYEKLRQQIIEQCTLTSLIQLEYSGFAGATVPICTFTFHNSHIDGYEGGYVRLSDFAGSENQAPRTLEAIQNPDCGWFYRRDAQTFTQIPGTPIAYWASEGLIAAFSHGETISGKTSTHLGMATCNNELFLRGWWEVPALKVGNPKRFPYDFEEVKWIPYNKGGSYRKWYGNDEFVVNWADGGRVLSRAGAVMVKDALRFKPMTTWTRVSSSYLHARVKASGYMFDMTGPAAFGSDADLSYVCGFLNSVMGTQVASFMSASLDFQPGQVGSYPLTGMEEHRGEVNSRVENCLDLSKSDWDSFETSWDFKRHPLL